MSSLTEFEKIYRCVEFPLILLEIIAESLLRMVDEVTRGLIIRQITSPPSWNGLQKRMLRLPGSLLFESI